MRDLWRTDLKLNERALKQKLPNNSFIFVGSGTDMFCDDMPKEYIKKSLNHLSKYNNKYLIQTKNPKRYKEFQNYMPSKAILSTTIETNINLLIDSQAPPVRERVEELKKIKGFEKSITFEPIMEFSKDTLIRFIKEIEPSFISIGAVTGNNDLVEPLKEKLKSFIEEAKKYTQVFLKHNIYRILND